MRAPLSTFFVMLGLATGIAAGPAADPALGAVLNVPLQFGTIQAAIDAATDGDIVLVQPGVYSGPGNTELNFGGRLITLRSTSPSSPEVVATTIIDCAGTGRAFTFENDETAEARVEGLTIRNGAGGTLGVIRTRLQTWPTFSDCVIRDCTGLAIRCTQQGKITLERCTIESNDSSSTAFGVVDVNYPLSGVVARGCVFRDNIGGAITFAGEFLTVENSLFENNSGGSAIRSTPAAQLTLHRCTFLGNSTPGSGGGVFFRPLFEPESVEIESCVFVDNSAALYGGGLYMLALNTTGDAAIGNCTFLRNAAGESGGNVGVSGRHLTIRNSILRGGVAPAGTELYLGPGVQNAPVVVPAGRITLDYAMMSDGPENVFFSDGAVLILGDGFSSADPLFVNEEAGDIHLRPNSPARDAGDPSFVPAPDALDIDGNPRIVGDAVDLGADEFNTPPILGDFDGDGDVDLADFGQFAQCFNGPGNPPAAGCTVNADLDGDGDIDLGDFGVFAANFTGPT